MSVWTKIKQWMGIGGVKLELAVAPQCPKGAGKFGGAVKLTSKSEQQVTSIEVKLVEEWSTGRGAEKKTKTLELGKTSIDGAFTLKAGEQRQIDFVVPFELVKSSNDRLKEKGGVLGAMGKAGAFMDSESSTYKIVADASVKGTAFGPGDSRTIQLV
jgi:hypothetical protein